MKGAKLPPPAETKDSQPALDRRDWVSISPGSQVPAASRYLGDKQKQPAVRLKNKQAMILVL